MIRALYRTPVTEYEFGSRPDGHLYAISKELLEVGIKHMYTKGNQEYFWRTGSVELVEITDDELYELVINSEKGWIWT